MRPKETCDCTFPTRAAEQEDVDISGLVGDGIQCSSVYHHWSCCSLRFWAPMATNLPFIILQLNRLQCSAAPVAGLWEVFEECSRTRGPAHTRAWCPDTVYSPTKPPRSNAASTAGRQCAVTLCDSYKIVSIRSTR